MRFEGQFFKETFTAFNKHFNLHDLGMLTIVHLSVSLSVVTPTGTPRHETTFALLEYCNRIGRCRDLLIAAVADRPRIKLFKQLLSQFDSFSTSKTNPAPLSKYKVGKDAKHEKASSTLGQQNQHASQKSKSVSRKVHFTSDKRFNQASIELKLRRLFETKQTGSLTLEQRRRVRSIIHSVSKSGSMQPLIDGIYQSDVKIKRFVIRALVSVGYLLKAGEFDPVGELSMLIMDDMLDSKSRALAAWALGASVPQSLNEGVLITLLPFVSQSSVSPTIRWRLAWAFGELKYLPAKGTLRKVANCKHEDQNVRRAAVYALGNIDPVGSSKMMRRIARDERGKLSSAALNIIEIAMSKK